METLKSFTYEEVYEFGEVSKEFKTADWLRRASARFKSRETGESTQLFAADYAKSTKEQTGEWPVLYPYDEESASLIAGMEKLSAYCDEVIAIYKEKIRGRGKEKKGKDTSDKLIVGLCSLYKLITGKEPISWPTGTSSFNSGQYTGMIIPFLQAILPHTVYNQSQSDAALSERIRRLRNSGKYADIWPSSTKK